MWVKKKMMSARERQKRIWNRKSKYGPNTHPDPFQSELELDFMLANIEGRVLNAGCGFGYETLKCAEKTGFAVGFDFSEKMIEIAKKSEKEGLTYRVCDALNLDPILEEFGQFDSITTRRLLINLCGWSDQRHALEEIKKCLKPDGRLIVIEAVQEGYDFINAIRTKIGIKEIKIVEHNYPLTLKEFNDFMKKNWRLAKEENMATYYFLTRVFYPLFGEPVYGSDFAEKSYYLQQKLGDIDIISPIIMGVFYVK